LKINEGIGWDGQIIFGVADEATVKKIGLENFLKGISDGSLKWKREYKQHNKITNYTGTSPIVDGTVQWNYISSQPVFKGFGMIST
jgi:hypothetical protein